MICHVTGRKKHFPGEMVRLHPVAFLGEKKSLSASSGTMNGDGADQVADFTMFLLPRGGIFIMWWILNVVSHLESPMCELGGYANLFTNK